MELAVHVIHHYRKKLALAYLDPRSSIYRRLKKNVAFGFLHPLFETPVNLWARFEGFTPADITELKRRPFVISPLDAS